MQSLNPKETVKSIIESLPNDAGYEDIIAEIYFKKNVEKGLKELDKGKGINHKEVKKRLKKWLK